MAFWYQIDSSIKKVSSSNIVLRHLQLEETGKKLEDEETLFDFSNRSRIWDFIDVTIILF